MASGASSGQSKGGREGKRHTPNAKLAFKRAHVLFMLIESPVTEAPKSPTDTAYVAPELTEEQFWLEIKRNSYTEAMKAPTKQRSMKATKKALDLERW